MSVVDRGTSAPRSPGRGDHGVFVLGSLLKTVLWVALIGVIGYDLISITTTQVTVRGDAQQAATVGSDTLHDTGDVTKAYAAVVAYARAHGEIVVAQGFTTGPHLGVRRERRDRHLELSTQLSLALPGDTSRSITRKHSVDSSVAPAMLRD